MGQSPPRARTIYMHILFYRDPKNGYRLKKGNSGLPMQAYVCDPRFRIWGAGIMVDDKPEMYYRDELVKFLQGIDEDDTIVAHNWMLQGLALYHHHGFKHHDVTDIYGLANAILGPHSQTGKHNTLDQLCKLPKITTMPTDRTRWDGLDSKKAKADDWDAITGHCIASVRLISQLYAMLGPRLSNPYFELRAMRHDLWISITRPITVNRQLAKSVLNSIQGQVEGITYRARAKASEKLDGEKLSNSMTFVGLLEPLLKKHGLVMPTKTGSKGQEIPALAQTDKGFMKLLDCGVPEIEDLVYARIVHKSARKYVKQVQPLTELEHLHLVTSYHEHLTGRSQGIKMLWNTPNIPHPDDAKLQVSKIAASGIRSALVPKSGHTFVRCTLQDPLVRIVAWLAGEDVLLDHWRSGLDIYNHYGTELLDELVEDPKESDQAERFDRMKALREVSFQAINRLQFGQSALDLYEALSANELVTQVLGVQLDYHYCTAIFNHYRHKFKTIVQLWLDLEQAFHHARTCSKGDGKQVGQVNFICISPGLAQHVVLPSGRRIRYADYREVEFAHGQKEWVYGDGKPINGCRLCRNIAQAIQRDITVEAKLQVDIGHGFPVVLDEYDSLVCQVPDPNNMSTDELNRSPHVFRTILTTYETPPSWAPDLALSAIVRQSETLL